ncbi:MAG: DUF5615 family PIN-like protein [Myxococcota bacterium]
MRFLVDQNVPVQVAAALREAGHHAEHTRERGLSRAEDEVLLAVARDEHSTIVTFDSDFARFLALSVAAARRNCDARRLGPLSTPAPAGRRRRAWPRYRRRRGFGWPVPYAVDRLNGGVGNRNRGVPEVLHLAS